MRAVEQTKIGGPDAPLAEQGNCLQACIASIFEIKIDEAPGIRHMSVDAEEWYIEIDLWAAERGYSVLWDVAYIPNAYGIRLVKSFRGAYNHCVVTRGYDIVWDPSPDRDDGERQDTELGPLFTYFLVLDPADWLPR